MPIPIKQNNNPNGATLAYHVEIYKTLYIFTTFNLKPC